MGLYRFNAGGHPVDVSLSITFFSVQYSWDLDGFSRKNLSASSVIPPPQFGAGFDITVDPPEACDKDNYVEVFVGSRYASVGTNVIRDPITGALRTQGVNFGVGISAGPIPFGVVIPQ
jgi:hypothetical protein